MNKYNSLLQFIKPLKKVLIAYSGGLDSSFLLFAAIEALGAENVLACIGISPSLAASQLKTAQDNADFLNAKLTKTPIGELQDRKYAANGPKKCFFCKNSLFKQLKTIARENTVEHILYGANYDDMSDYRPGHEAAENYNAVAPLAELKFSKDNIRSLCRKFSLPFAEMPASPCLASRIAYGIEITAERLKQVELAEDYLRSKGFVEFRVRHHDQIARIEVTAEQFNIFSDIQTRKEVCKKIISLGFKFISVDLKPFKSGSLNKLIDK